MASTFTESFLRAFINSNSSLADKWSSEVVMLGFLLVVVAMLVLLRFRLEMVARLEGGSRELVGIGQLFSCIWSSVSVMGLVVVSVLEVDRMGVVGREVVMVNFVSNGGQVELFS